MSKPTLTLYRMTADYTGEHLHVLFQVWTGQSSVDTQLPLCA